MMDKRQAEQMQKEMAGAVNLLAHPVAGAAALSAFGFGLASHVWGAWLGALTATAQASQRMLGPDAHSATGGAGGRTRKAAEKKHDARTAVVADLKCARQPVAIARPQAPGDLKAIPGIGPKLEQVLNGLGVWNYEQIADWSEEEIAWVDDHLGVTGRIVRDDWIGQAAALVRAKTKN